MRHPAAPATHQRSQPAQWQTPNWTPAQQLQSNDIGHKHCLLFVLRAILPPFTIRNRANKKQVTISAFDIHQIHLVQLDMVPHLNWKQLMSALQKSKHYKKWQNYDLPKEGRQAASSQGPAQGTPPWHQECVDMTWIMFPAAIHQCIPSLAYQGIDNSDIESAFIFRPK